MVRRAWSTPSFGGDSTWLTCGPRSRFLPTTCIRPSSPGTTGGRGREGRTARGQGRSWSCLTGPAWTCRSRCGTAKRSHGSRRPPVDRQSRRLPRISAADTHDPAEVLDRFPAPPRTCLSDGGRCRARRTGHLVSMARHWVDQPASASDRPRAGDPARDHEPRVPGRLDAIAAAGPACCTPHPSLGGSPGGGTSRLPGQDRLGLEADDAQRAACAPGPASPARTRRSAAWPGPPHGCARTASGPPRSPPTRYRGTSRSSWTATAAGPNSAACLVQRDIAPVSRPCTTLSTAPWRSGCPPHPVRLLDRELEAGPRRGHPTVRNARRGTALGPYPARGRPAPQASAP